MYMYNLDCSEWRLDLLDKLSEIFWCSDDNRAELFHFSVQSWGVKLDLFRIPWILVCFALFIFNFFNVAAAVYYLSIWLCSYRV